jgi:hypothetical protein
MRNTLNPPGSPLQVVDTGLPMSSQSQSVGSGTPQGAKENKYEDITDVIKLERLIKAKEKTRAALEQKVGWVAMEQARAEDAAAKAASNGA